MAIMGVIGLLAVDMLSQGADIYVNQSNRKKFISQARSTFWHIQQNMRNQSDAENYYQSGIDLLSILVNLYGSQKQFILEYQNILAEKIMGI